MPSANRRGEYDSIDAKSVAAGSIDDDWATIDESPIRKASICQTCPSQSLETPMRWATLAALPDPVSIGLCSEERRPHPSTIP